MIGRRRQTHRQVKRNPTRRYLHSTHKGKKGRRSSSPSRENGSLAAMKGCAGGEEEGQEKETEKRECQAPNDIYYMQKIKKNATSLSQNKKED